MRLLSPDPTMYSRRLSNRVSWSFIGCGRFYLPANSKIVRSFVVVLPQSRTCSTATDPLSLSTCQNARISTRESHLSGSIGAFFPLGSHHSSTVSRRPCPSQENASGAITAVILFRESSREFSVRCSFEALPFGDAGAKVSNVIGSPGEPHPLLSL
jgi:hypothetical protein